MYETLLPYDIDGQAFDAFVAREKAHAETHAERPVVLVCHAWGGRNDFAEDKARALARLGYIGVAIDLYGVGVRGVDPASSRALMMALVAEPAVLRRRLAAALEVAHQIPGADRTRAAVIGFCFGGMCALLMGRMGLPIRGAVSFHGLLKIGEKLDATVKARLLVLHGQNDPMAPPSDVGTFADEMKRINADWQLHAYPGVMHAFTQPTANSPESGMVYNAEADRRSWRTTVAFLDEVLVDEAAH